MATECLFRDDSYLRDCEARVVAVTEQGGAVLDRTVFYATSGGQPGDSGILTLADGRQVPIATAVYTDAAKTEIAHVPAPGAAAFKAGDRIIAKGEPGRDPEARRIRIYSLQRPVDGWIWEGVVE